MTKNNLAYILQKTGLYPNFIKLRVQLKKLHSCCFEIEKQQLNFHYFLHTNKTIQDRRVLTK